MSHTIRVAAVVIFLAGVVAGCGGSRQFSPAERAAIRAAQRHNPNLRIFPRRTSGPITCPLGLGGPAPGVIPGSCMTFISMYGKWPVIDFVARLKSGQFGRWGWTVVLDPHNRPFSAQPHGSAPVIR
jgi:hypothetical protein